MHAEHIESRRKRFRNHINRIARLRRSNQRLRHKLEGYRRVLLVVGVAVAVLGFSLGFMLLKEPEPVLLGVGEAGLKSQAEHTADSLLAARRTADSIRAAREEAATKAAPTDSGRHLGSGQASYYGDELAGNRTASGEAFDPDALTAAHRTLPLGTRVRVINVRNGKSVIVRINDRGPFAGHRVIDLSRSAASRIGLLASGTGMVRLELLPR